MTEISPKNLQDDTLLYKTHEGVAVFTHIGIRLIEYAEQQPLKKIKPFENVPLITSDIDESKQTKSSVALHAASMKINRPFYSVKGRREYIRDMCDIDPDTLRDMLDHNSIEAGLADTDFLGHFAPAVAAAAVGFLASKNVISEAQHRALTLTDYGHVIGSGWFSTIMHDLARTSNGAYGGYGRDYIGYTYERFADLLELRSLCSKKQEPFELANVYEPEDGYKYHVALTSDSLRRGLRQRLYKDNQPEPVTRGCPVARHNVTLSQEFASKNSAAQTLRANGHIIPTGKALRDPKNVHHTIPYSAIDLGLMQLGSKLIDYDQMYGTPYLTTTWSGYFKWRHVRRDPVDAFRYKESTI